MAVSLGVTLLPITFILLLSVNDELTVRGSPQAVIIPMNTHTLFLCFEMWLERRILLDKYISNFLSSQLYI